jgi:hypothetical protein
MADIEMCRGHECPLKHDCHRYNAKPSEDQSYIENPPYEKDKGRCEMYWPIDKYTNV